jgi:hypothetical protein
MDHSAVLNVRAGTDPNIIDVAANNAAEPNASFLADLNVADDLRTLSNESRRVYPGCLVIKASDHRFLACRRSNI